MSKKNFFSWRWIVSIFLIILFIAAISFHQGLIKCGLRAAIAREAFAGYQVKLPNFRISSYNLKHFCINTGLNLKLKNSSENFIDIKNIKLELDVLSGLKAFKVPLEISVNGLDVDLNFSKQLDWTKFFSYGKGVLMPQLVEIADVKAKVNELSYSVSFNQKHIDDRSLYEIILLNGQHASNISLDKQASKVKLSFAKVPVPVVLKLMSFRDSYQIPKDLVITGTVDADLANSKAVAKFYSHKLDSNATNDRALFVVAHASRSGIVSIDKAVLTVNDNIIEASGNIRLAKGLFKDKHSLKLVFNADKASADFIKIFCSFGEVSETKNWCLRSIKAGMLTKVRGVVQIDDLYSSKDQTPNLSLKADFQGLDLKYSERFPQIDDMNGSIVLNMDFLTFHIRGGKMINTILSPNSIVKIALSDADTPIFIKTHAIGPAKDFINFIPPENQATLMDRKIKITEIGGDTDAQVNIVIPLSKEVNLQNMTLNVNANIANMKLQAFDAELSGNMKLIIKEHLLQVLGSPLVNGEATNLTWETHLDTNPEFDNRMILETVNDQKQKSIELFGGSILIKGNALPAKIMYLDQNNSEHIKVNTDLRDVRVEVPYAVFVKEAGKQASCDMVLERQGNIWKTDKFKFVAPEDNLSVDVYGEFTKNLDSIMKLNSDVKSKDNNLKIDLDITGPEYKLQIKGSSIVPNLEQLFQVLGSKSLAAQKKMSISIQVDKAILNNSVTLDEVSGRLECYKNKCTKDALTMKINNQGKTSAPMKVYNKNGAFVIYSGDADSLLRGLNFYHEVEGGAITIKIYPATKTSELRGSVHMTDFKAIKTPLIARLIIMTPFTQLVEQLKGSNLISFKSFNGSFVMKGNRVQINRSVAMGGLLTVTMKGYVDTLKKTISLKGRLVPSCLFNKFLSSIENKASPENAKLGTDYKIDGDLSDPKISVNPISLLMSLITKPLSII